MTTRVITNKPGLWQHRALTIGHLLGEGAVITLHLVLAVVVLTVRIAYAILGAAAHAATYTELYVAERTGRRPIGQETGVAIAAVLTQEFRTAYHQPTR